MSSDYQERPEVTGWVGWLIFASVMMIITGVLSVIEGLSALLRDEAYFVGTAGNSVQVLTFNLTTWGWIHLILGIALVLVGVMLMKGSTFGLVAAGIIVGLQLVAQFAWLGAQPWWSVIVIAINTTILYALFVHGDELA